VLPLSGVQRTQDTDKTGHVPKTASCVNHFPMVWDNIGMKATLRSARSESGWSHKLFHTRDKKKGPGI